VRVRFLNQVLRIVVGAGETERRTVEAVEVVREPLGIEPAPGGGGWLWVSRGFDGATLASSARLGTPVRPPAMPSAALDDSRDGMRHAAGCAQSTS
jgi:hypothetical protein